MAHATESTQVDLRALLEHRASLPASATVEMAQAEFARSRWNFLAVIEGDEFLGVCARRELMQQLGSRFGFALNARHRMSEHLMVAPLCVTLGTPINDLFKAVAARASEAFYDDVVLVDGQGRYVGMIAMRAISRLQTEFLLANIDRLEASRQEIAAKNREMELDLQMAREVQLAMQPKDHAPVVAERRIVRLAHLFQPAGGVSGDFFDVLHPTETTVAVLVCDVMGHGVRSALITAMVRAIVETLRPVAADPGTLLTRLNADLTRILRRVGSLIFVTAAYVVVDLVHGRLRYAQAGHPTPLRAERGRREFRAIACPPEVEGPALGLIDDFVFTTTEEAIAPGDRVVLFTDGVFEAAPAGGEEFSLRRLADVLAKGMTLPLDALLPRVVAEVAEACGGAPFGDDVCLVVLEMGEAPPTVPAS